MIKIIKMHFDENNYNIIIISINIKRIKIAVQIIIIK